MDGWASALEDSGLSRAIRGPRWLYPGIETAHILGFIVLVGSIALFDVRLLGASRHVSVRELGSHLRKWSLGSVALVVPTGLLLFTAHPIEHATNPVFGIKLSAIALAGLNAAAFHFGVHRSVASWDRRVAAPPLARFHALASLALWITTVTCGRLLAYT